MGSINKTDLIQNEFDAQAGDRFTLIVNYTLQNEGGYVNHPSDPGGETNFGITKRSYPDIDIRNLTREGAIDIYYKDFWLKYPFSEITDFDICRKFFRMAVNMGYTQSAKLLQRAVGGLTADGIIGPFSISAINHSDPVNLLNKYRQIIGDFYIDLAIKKPKTLVFLKGWVRSAYR